VPREYQRRGINRLVAIRKARSAIREKRNVKHFAKTLTDLERCQRSCYRRLSNLLLELGMLDELIDLARKRVSELSPSRVGDSKPKPSKNH
jgi:hypothetical protein